MKLTIDTDEKLLLFEEEGKVRTFDLYFITHWPCAFLKRRNKS